MWPSGLSWPSWSGCQGREGSQEAAGLPSHRGAEPSKDRTSNDRTSNNQSGNDGRRRHRAKPGVRSPISWPAGGHARVHWYPGRRPGGVTAVR
jgi:hypothetical protein